MLKKTIAFLLCAATVAVWARPAAAQDGVAGRGYELFEAGAWRAAQAELVQALAEVDPGDGTERARIEFYLARCAAELGESDGKELMSAFLAHHPGSIYADRARLAIAGYMFDAERWADALGEYALVEEFGLTRGERQELDFKVGYCHFMLGRQAEALGYFRRVTGGEYLPHAQYYIAYMEYAGGNLVVAKEMFAAMQGAGPYAAVAPFYLLQIEFRQGNYDYVTERGEGLLAGARGPRVAEIARIVAESWFHKRDFAQALRYMDVYRENGGGMDRPANYIVGYSQYELNDVADAIAALSLVAGPDDRLTQNAAYHLGACFLRLGEKREAMRAFSMAADAAFDPVIREDALFNYGKLQFELGGGVFNEAINVLRRYIGEYPASQRVREAREYLVAAYYNSRDFDAAYEAIKALPDPDNSIRAAFQKIAYFRALEYYEAGDRDRAYATMQEALANSFNPKYTALTRFWLGEMLYERGDLSGAVEQWRAYVNLSPATEREHRMALYNLGYAYFNRQQWADSRVWFDRFLTAHTAADGYRADALNRVGDIQFARREFWAAIESYDAAARVGTTERYYSAFQRAMMLGLVDRRERKIESLQAIINSGQGGYVDDAQYELGRTYIGMERFADAAAALKRFVERYPSSERNSAALSDLGLVYQNLGDERTALEYYKTVVTKAPGSAEARDAMLAIRSIYVDMNSVDQYFAYARSVGMDTDLGAAARDSIAFVAAQNVYLSGSPADVRIAAVRKYLDGYPRGAYRPAALWFVADLCLSAGRRDDAVRSLTELSGMYYNSYTVRALERLAPLLSDAGRNAEAAETYKKLAATAVNPETVSAALSGYLRASAAVGYRGVALAAADDLLGRQGVADDVRREAMIMRAGALEDADRRDEALTIYRELATEVRSLVGARATLKVIEAQWAAGDGAGAERAILAFAAADTPHRRQLAEAFLVLGDIYAARGDNFQARATLQSIVDGYSDPGDGIVEAARRRINNLK